MQTELAKRLPQNCTVLSSSAQRTRLTCEGLELEAEFRDDLYHASGQKLLEICAEHEHSKNLIIVGHNPGLTEFVNHITQDYIDNVPTLGICFINITTLGPVRGQLREFIYPKKYKDRY
ncbi:MAG: hypothetical protein CME65_08415 [Halobacteriovoraceae bacterium]|nr:hypothetical protein [Halobacteriovoraceae bacterium]|tara:strand:- start:10221 stop:10577 length:357 start_codon:yes stop_codon:yes gene_type:complete